MKILALDLGTTVGWACRGNGKFQAGSRLLASTKQLSQQRKLRFDRRLDFRIPALWECIEDIEEHYGTFDWLLFEDVQFAVSTQQVQLWSSFRAAVWLYAYQNDRKVECLATGKLKQFATCCGAATKEMMAAWLCKQLPNEVRFYDGAIRQVDNNVILDDNAVDAAHLLLWGERVLKNE